MNLFATSTPTPGFAKRNGFFQDEAIRKPIVVSKLAAEDLLIATTNSSAA